MGEADGQGIPAEMKSSLHKIYNIGKHCTYLLDKINGKSNYIFTTAKLYANY